MTDEPVMPQIVCPVCSHTLDAAADECPECGTKFALPSAGPDTTRAGKSNWTESPRVIISLMVFAALFLGFPLLWRSPQFSLAGKIFWSVFVSLETALLLWAVWWALDHLVTTLREHPLW